MIRRGILPTWRVKALLCTLRQNIPPNVEEYLVIYTYLSLLNHSPHPLWVLKPMGGGHSKNAGWIWLVPHPKPLVLEMPLQ